MMRIASRSGGLPVAAYLGLLIALALAAAFIAVLAIVIWLPPRPPDVMRMDVLTERFAEGYAQARATGQVPHGDAMAWRIVPDAPAPAHGHARHFMRMPEIQLAHALELRPPQVRVRATRIERGDTFVFQVRTANRAAREAEAAAREADGSAREAEARAREALRWNSERDEGRDEQTTSRVTIIERYSDEPRNEAGAIVVPPVPPAADGPVVAPIPPMPPMFAPAPVGVMLVSGFELSAQLSDGRWLLMRQGRNWDELSWIVRAALIIGATLTVLLVLAALFASRLTRPIRSFSQAVQAVGVDPASSPVREEGPSELRGAARAVNTMQARLRALIADRTKTLAAVAHDMRTPLMRLRLSAENVPAEQRERMVKEIGEVEALVASFIAFARDDPAEEARVRVDLSALLQSIADDHADQGRRVSFEGVERVVVTGQSLGLKRLFSNLVDNALKHGAEAHIQLTAHEDSVIVDVIDNGPGIPEQERERVFEPFVRLAEGASGAGLGLAAARTIARAHGGDVTILDARPGAHFQVKLPR
jgi:signal transduction histidine kinase